MGLDVYLRRYEDFEGTTSRSQIAEEEAEAVWNEYPSYETMTGSQKEEARERGEAVYAKYGFGNWGEISESEAQSVELPSRTNPDHLFKIGYWRSSYNDGGINSVLARQIGMTLYDICEVENNHDYEFQLDWEAVIENCQEAIAKLEALPNYDVITFRNFLNKTHSAEEALSIFRKEATKKSFFGSGYSNGHGDFFHESPLTVLAVMPGERGDVHLITQTEEGTAFYVEALKIIIETCEYVLSQPDREKYYVTWSS